MSIPSCLLCSLYLSSYYSIVVEPVFLTCSYWMYNCTIGDRMGESDRKRTNPVLNSTYQPPRHVSNYELWSVASRHQNVISIIIFWFVTSKNNLWYLLLKMMHEGINTLLVVTMVTVTSCVIILLGVGIEICLHSHTTLLSREFPGSISSMNRSNRIPSAPQLSLYWNRYYVLDGVSHS